MTRLITAQKNIIEALGEDTLKTDELAIKAGYELSDHFRKTVASLRKRGVIGNNRPGINLPPFHPERRIIHRKRNRRP